MGKRELAISHLCAALVQDPLLWSAYEELCNLGELASDPLRWQLHSCRLALAKLNALRGAQA